MRNKKARKVRKVVGFKSSEPRTYKDYPIKRTIEIPGQGTIDTYVYTRVSEGKRRVYKIAKKIYKVYKVLPRIQETNGPEQS